jgi:hypothetical protein
MITKAYIHEYGNSKIEPEHMDVKQVLESRGIPCELFTTKRLVRNQLPIDSETLVVGDNPTILLVLKKLGIHWVNDSYPASLRLYLKRTIWESTIRKLLIESNHREISHLFVKPKSKAKLFTGFVIASNDDLYFLDRFSGDTDIYCSSVVNWFSEFRVFVIRSKIVGIKCYAGDEGLTLNMEFVENAVRAFENSDQRTNAYGIDFGILENGETALIEWNDGFALGSYDLEKEVYTKLILARWEEIMKNRPS